MLDLALDEVLSSKPGDSIADEEMSTSHANQMRNVICASSRRPRRSRLNQVCRTQRHILKKAVIKTALFDEDLKVQPRLGRQRITKPVSCP